MELCRPAWSIKYNQYNIWLVHKDFNPAIDLPCYNIQQKQIYWSDRSRIDEIPKDVLAQFNMYWQSL